MGWETNEKHLLSLSHQSLQSLCKEYNLPANKTHSQLARVLAIYLENEQNNTGPEKENLTGPTSTQASPAASAAVLPNTKETSKCEQDNHKRGPYSDRDDDDRPPLKHKKVSKKQVDRKLRSDSGTRTSLPPVSSNNGEVNCFNSSSGQGIAHNVKPQTADGIATSSKAPKLKIGNHVSAAPVNDTISFVASHPGPNGVASKPPSHRKAGTNGIDKDSGLSSEIPANVNSSFELLVMDEDGIDLFVDLNSTPGDWTGSFKGGVNLPPSTHNSETDMFTNSISSLLNKNDQNTTSLSDSIIMDIQDKEPESIAACTNSSLGSTGENSHPKSNPHHTTAVNLRSSVSTLPCTPVEISVSQEGPPVVHSPCLTSDVQNNVPLDMMADAMGSNVLPQESVDVSMSSGRSHPSLADYSIQPTNEGTFSLGKTKACVKNGCTQNVLDAHTDKAVSSPPRHVVVSDTGKNSRPPSVGKEETLDATSGVQRARNSDANGLLTENVTVGAVAMEEYNGHGGSLSVRQLSNQPVIALPAANAPSDANSADRGVAGNFELTNSTQSPVASDNAVTPLATNHGAKTSNNHDSAKERPCDAEELQGVPTRNITVLSLRSAAAKQAKPRRSSRLLPK